MKKKIVSVFIAVCVVISCLSIGFTAFATTRVLELNVKTTNQLDGFGDMNMYTFTPEKSGTYSFLSYNINASEAYLFIREKDPVTYQKLYTQLAYSRLSENYKKYGQPGLNQFCLTYHLDAGTTYYFGAGWTMDKTYERGDTDMTVMLICEEYDEKIIKSIDIDCPAVLRAYIDGEWRRNNDDTASYFYYDISKLLVNMKITITYSDGRTRSAMADLEEIDGYEITFRHNQLGQHWQPQSTTDYTANTLTIKIADASVDFDVPIKITAMYAVQGIIQDYAGNPVNNAKVVCNGVTLATTDQNGRFYRSLNSGAYSINIQADNAISREFMMIVSAEPDGNNFTAKPIKIVTCDYVADGIINAKDYSYMIKNLSANELEKQKAQFGNAINFSKTDYESFTLPNKS